MAIEEKKYTYANGYNMVNRSLNPEKLDWKVRSVEYVCKECGLKKTIGLMGDVKVPELCSNCFKKQPGFEEEQKKLREKYFA